MHFATDILILQPPATIWQRFCPRSHFIHQVENGQSNVKLCRIKLRRFLRDFLIFPAGRWISGLTILRLFRSTPSYLNQQPNRPGVADHLDQLKTISHLYCGQILADMLPSCISMVIGRCLSMVDTRS